MSQFQREPDFLYAGDSLVFERYFRSYPASQGWFLDYEIRGNSQPISFQSTADGDNHQVTVAPAVTSQWLASDDTVLAGFAVNNTTNPPQRYEIYYQAFPIKKNLPGSAGDIPVKTQAQKMVEALEQLLCINAADNLLETRIGDTLFRFESREKIREEWGFWTMIRRHEIAVERARNRKPSQRRMPPLVGITPPGPLFGTQAPFPYGGGNV